MDPGRIDQDELVQDNYRHYSVSNQDKTVRARPSHNFENNVYQYSWSKHHEQKYPKQDPPEPKPSYQNPLELRPHDQKLTEQKFPRERPPRRIIQNIGIKNNMINAYSKQLVNNQTVTSKKTVTKGNLTEPRTILDSVNRKDSPEVRMISDLKIQENRGRCIEKKDIFKPKKNPVVKLEENKFQSGAVIDVDTARKTPGNDLLRTIVPDPLKTDIPELQITSNKDLRIKRSNPIERTDVPRTHMTSYKDLQNKNDYFLSKPHIFAPQITSTINSSKKEITLLKHPTLTKSDSYPKKNASINQDPISLPQNPQLNPQPTSHPTPPATYISRNPHATHHHLSSHTHSVPPSHKPTHSNISNISSSKADCTMPPRPTAKS